MKNEIIGAAEKVRTPNIQITKLMRYQLRHDSIFTKLD